MASSSTKKTESSITACTTPPENDRNTIFSTAFGNVKRATALAPEQRPDRGAEEHGPTLPLAIAAAGRDRAEAEPAGAQATHPHIHDMELPIGLIYASVIWHDALIVEKQQMFVRPRSRLLGRADRWYL